MNQSQSQSKQQTAKDTSIKRKEENNMEYTTELGLRYVKEDVYALKDFMDTLDNDDYLEVVLNGLEDCLDGEYYQNLLADYCAGVDDVYWQEFIEKVQKEGKERE